MMPDENRFQSISSQLDEDATDEDDDSSTTSEMTDPQPTDPQPTDPEQSTIEPTTDHDPDADQMSTPAFEYEAVKKNSVYPRAETWEAFDAALTLANGKLRTKHGLSAVEQRELHDAALREIAEHPDRLVERVLELRGIDTVSDR